MSIPSDRPDGGNPVDLHDFVLAVSGALHGAAARSPRDRFLPPVLIGIYSPPSTDWPGLPGYPGAGDTAPQPQAVRVPADLRMAGGELSEEGVARLNTRLEGRRDGAEVAIALFTDPVQAMADLFTLNEEQLAEIRQNACGNAGLPFMAQAVRGVMASGMPMQLDFRIAEDARTQQGRKWCAQSFTLGGSGSVSGGASGVGGGATLSGSVTFGRCKK